MKIFVFGSNLLGRHGSGAARYAKQHYGAVYGEGIGRTGNAYGIPTKYKGLMDPEDVIPLVLIQTYVTQFIIYANTHSNLTFELTRIGCGLAGYKDEQIAPMFKGVSKNVIIPEEWKKYHGQDNGASI